MLKFPVPSVSVRTFFLTLVLVLFASVPGAAQTLVVAYQENNAEPYLLLRDGKVVSGIIKDISDALAKELGVKVEYRLVPRKRLEADAATGEVSVISVFNPAWAHEPEALLWSKPLFAELNLLVVQPKTGPLVNRSDLEGLRIGTILGYHYIGLEDLFARGVVFRDDVRNLTQNFQKLAAGRIDAMVDSDILIRWKLQHLDSPLKATDFQIADVVLSRQEIYWAVSPRSAISPSRILAGLETLKRSGQIEQVLALYR